MQTRFTYRCVQCSYDCARPEHDLAEHIDAMAADGWKLIQILPAVNASGRTLIFERPVSVAAAPAKSEKPGVFRRMLGRAGVG